MTHALAPTPGIKTQSKTSIASQPPVFKPGDLIKAASGRTYKVELVLKTGQLKGREQKKVSGELTGPTRTFKVENVSKVEAGGAVATKRKAARKRVKPGQGLKKTNAAAPSSKAKKNQRRRLPGAGQDALRPHLRCYRNQQSRLDARG